MCQSINRPERNVCIWEGWARWISERETIEERLVAYETIMAIAFPEDDSRPYQPPQRPTDGNRLSKCDLIRRDVYNQWHGIIENRAGRNGMKVKDPRRVELGRMAMAKRWGKQIDADFASNAGNSSSGASTVDMPDDSSSDDGSSVETPTKDKPTPVKRVNVVKEQAEERERHMAQNHMPEDDITPYHKPSRYSKELSVEDQMQIAKWRKKFPDEKALQEYIKKEWTLPNRELAITDGFCAYAFRVLDRESNWCSSRDHRPLIGVDRALHWLAVRYKTYIAEVEAADKKIASRKDAETKQSNAEAQAFSEMKMRREAEREAMKKIRRGEILGDA